MDGGEIELMAEIEQMGEVELVLVCPRCERRYPRSPDADAGVVRVTCDLCRTAFAAELVRVVRAQSHLERRTGTRRFRVRVDDGTGAERALALRSYGHAEFPLGPDEWAIVARVGGKVRAVQDPAGGRFVKVRPGRGEWLPRAVGPAWAAAGVAAVTALAAKAWPG